MSSGGATNPYFSCLQSTYAAGAWSAIINQCNGNSIKIQNWTRITSYEYNTVYFWVNVSIQMCRACTVVILNYCDAATAPTILSNAVAGTINSSVTGVTYFTCNQGYSSMLIWHVLYSILNSIQLLTVKRLMKFPISRLNKAAAALIGWQWVISITKTLIHCINRNFSNKQFVNYVKLPRFRRLFIILKLLFSKTFW